MKRFIIICFFCSIAYPMLHGQSSQPIRANVKGLIIDSIDNQTIPYATIRVFLKPDMAKPIKELATDDSGKFDIWFSTKGEYILAINFTGKNELNKNITIDKDEKIDLGKLAMSEAGRTLKTVEVSAIRPLIKVDIDKITYSLEEDPESKTNNLLEMMKKVPMITVDAEDNIQLKGSSNYKIYLNGKPSDMITKNPKDVLKSMPANTIKDIEIITEPGAKYDAEGVVGIINIVTKKSTSLVGYTVSINAGADHRGGYNMGSYGSLKKGKLGVTGNISNYTYKNPYGNSNTTTEYHDESSVIKEKETENGRSKQDGNGVYGRIEISYEIDTLNLININGGGYAGNGKSTSNFNTKRENMINNTPIYEYNRNGRSEYNYGSPNWGIDYQRTFNVKDRLLTSSYRYNHSPDDFESYTNVDTVYMYDTSNTQQFSNTLAKEHTFQIDFVTPFAKIHTLEAGAKYIIRLSESDNRLDSLMRNNSWKPIVKPTNKFEHNQYILAFYAGYSLKYKKWGIKTGLRFESTALNAKYPINNNYNFVADYSNFVPSVSVAYQLKESQNIRMGYNMRISRPSIWQLNPYEDTSNPSLYYRGNPNLNAAKSHNIHANHSIFNSKFNINTNLSYYFMNDAVERITELIKVGGNDVRRTTYENIGKNKNLSASIDGSWSVTEKIRLNGNLNGTYANLKSSNLEIGGNSGFSGSAFGGVQITLPWTLRANINGGLSGSHIALQGTNSGYSYYAFAINKSLLKEKLNISLRASNPFTKEMVHRSKQSTNQYRSESESFYAHQYFGINVSWRFGDMKAQIKKATRSINNDDSMGGSQGGGASQGSR